MMEHDTSRDNEATPQPAKAFQRGIVAGIAVILIGALAVLAFGGAKSEDGYDLLEFIPIISAVFAAASAAKERKLSVAIIALLCAFLVYLGLTWILLILFTVGQTAEGIAVGYTAGFLWKKYFIISFFTVVCGALIGMIFGNPSRPYERPWDIKGQ